MEADICRRTAQAEERGDREALQALTRESALALFDLAGSLAEDISAQIASLGGLYGVRKEFLEDYCRRTGLPL